MTSIDRDWSCSMTGFQLADSAKAPWTRTMVGRSVDLVGCSWVVVVIVDCGGGRSGGPGGTEVSTR
jgi:hypothetical protein